MKKMILVLLAGIAFSAFASVATAADAAAASTKIGVVDVRQVLQKSPQMAALNAQLEKQFKPRQDKIAASQKNLQTDIDKLNKDGATMNANDRTQLQNKVITERADLQAAAGTFQQDLNNAQTQGMQKILNDAAAVIGEVGKKDNYTLIVSKDVALYFKPEQDITSVISDKLNAAGKK